MRVVDIFPPQILAPRYFFVISFRNSGFKNNEPKVQEHAVKNCLLLDLLFFMSTLCHYLRVTALRT